MASLHQAGPSTGAAGVECRTGAGGPVHTHAVPAGGVADPATAQAGAPELLSAQIVAELDELEGVTVGALFALYFDEAVRQMAEIGSAMSRGDAPTVGETAHRLRGSSSTLGAAHVAQIATELEASARAGDLAVGGEVLVRLRSGLQDTRQALRHNRAVAAATTRAAMTQSDSDRLAATPEKAR